MPVHAALRADREALEDPAADPRVAGWLRDLLAPGLPVGAWFPCPIAEHTGRARIAQRTRRGAWWLECACEGATERIAPSRIAAASAWAGGPASRSAIWSVSPTQTRVWALRVLHESGAHPVPLPAVPVLGDDASAAEVAVLAGLALLTGLRTAHDDAPDRAGEELYTVRFAAAWTGLSKSPAGRAIKALRKRGAMVRGRDVPPSAGRNRPGFTYALPMPEPRAIESAPSLLIAPRVADRQAVSGSTYFVPRDPGAPAFRHLRPTGTSSGPVRRAVQELPGPVCDVVGHLEAWRFGDLGWRCRTCDPPPRFEVGRVVSGGAS